MFSSLSSPCYTINKGFPSQIPILSVIYPFYSNSGIYTQVNCTGTNFLHGANNTIIYFTNEITNSSPIILPVTFYSSENISFVVPTDLLAGLYNVKVAILSTIFNNTTLLFSNSLEYTII